MGGFDKFDDSFFNGISNSAANYFIYIFLNKFLCYSLKFRGLFLL